MQSSPSQSPFLHAVMAAPMVRVSTLAFRLLCGHYGSSVVFTEELVSAKLMKCNRRYLPQLHFLLDNDKVPEKFASVLSRLSQSGGEDSDAEKIACIVRKWILQFPFLQEAIFAGRVEGLYAGHHHYQQQQQQQQNKNGKTAVAAAVEGEEESLQGEIVFTTLANLLPSLNVSSAFSASEKSFEENLKHHCRFQLSFPKKEAGKPLVGQIGASDPNIAVAGFALLAPFVSACDINMGCPKPFSVKNGMGAALMANKDGAASILKALADSFPFLPVSYKTRLFEDVKDSFHHLKACFDATGKRLHAYTIHSRNRPQRSETAPLYNDATTLLQLIRADDELKNLCVIFNGSVALRPLPSATSSTTTTISEKRNDNNDHAASERKEIDVLLSNSLCGRDNVLKTITSYGFDGALLARSAMWKPSVFVNENELLRENQKIKRNVDDDDDNDDDKINNINNNNTSSPSPHELVIQTIIREFQTLAIAYAACGDQTRLLKYHLTRVIPEYRNADSAIGRGYDAKQFTTEINQSLFFPIRDGKTLSEFAQVLKFSAAEIEALNWLCDLVQWRRSLASLVVEESWNPYNPKEDAEPASTFPERRQRTE